MTKKLNFTRLIQNEIAIPFQLNTFSYFKDYEKDSKLVFIILFLSSCVVYYKTEDVRKTIVSNVNIANDNQSSTKKDYGDKLDAYQWLEGYILNKDLEPFKSITKYKNKMFKTYEIIRIKTDEIKVLQFTFENIAKGKKKIKSNEEIWQDFKEIKKKNEKYQH